MRFIGRLVAKVFQRLSDAGWSRGARGNGLWLAIAVLIGGMRVLGRLGSRRREVVFTQELLPGEVFKIGHLLEDRKGRPAK